MTVGTGSPFALVRSGIDREPGVIEDRPGPCRRVMARLAGGGEGGGNVVRVRRSCVLRFMARVAVGWSPSVLPVDVAARAGHARMGAGQREHCLAVIKRRRDPGCCAVAHLAVGGEAAGDVIGIGGALEISQMARNAGSAQADKDSARVTAAAGQGNVRAGERKRSL